MAEGCVGISYGIGNGVEIPSIKEGFYEYACNGGFQSLWVVESCCRWCIRIYNTNPLFTIKNNKNYFLSHKSNFLKHIIQHNN